MKFINTARPSDRRRMQSDEKFANEQYWPGDNELCPCFVGGPCSYDDEELRAELARSSAQATLSLVQFAS